MCELVGSNHCGRKNTLGKNRFKYEVSLRVKDSELDERGFVLAQEDLAKVFESLKKTSLSCELLAMMFAREIVSNAGPDRVLTCDVKIWGLWSGNNPNASDSYHTQGSVMFRWRRGDALADISALGEAGASRAVAASGATYSSETKKITAVLNVDGFDFEERLRETLQGLKVDTRGLDLEAGTLSVSIPDYARIVSAGLLSPAGVMAAPIARFPTPLASESEVSGYYVPGPLPSRVPLGEPFGVVASGPNRGRILRGFDVSRDPRDETGFIQVSGAIEAMGQMSGVMKEVSKTAGEIVGRLEHTDDGHILAPEELGAPAFTPKIMPSQLAAGYKMKEHPEGWTGGNWAYDPFADDDRAVGGEGEFILYRDGTAVDRKREEFYTSVDVAQNGYNGTAKPLNEKTYWPAFVRDLPEGGVTVEMLAAQFGLKQVDSLQMVNGGAYRGPNILERNATTDSFILFEGGAARDTLTTKGYSAFEVAKLLHIPPLKYRPVFLEYCMNNRPSIEELGKKWNLKDPLGVNRRIGLRGANPFKKDDPAFSSDGEYEFALYVDGTAFDFKAQKSYSAQEVAVLAVKDRWQEPQKPADLAAAWGMKTRRDFGGWKGKNPFESGVDFAQKAGFVLHDTGSARDDLAGVFYSIGEIAERSGVYCHRYAPCIFLTNEKSEEALVEEAASAAKGEDFGESFPIPLDTVLPPALPVIYDVPTMAKRLGLKPVEHADGFFNGANSLEVGPMFAAKWGFVLHPDGSAYDRVAGKDYSAQDVARLAGVSFTQYLPLRAKTRAIEEAPEPRVYKRLELGGPWSPKRNKKESP